MPARGVTGEKIFDLRKVASSRSNQPIGIFDSGIGGLTVAQAVNVLLPNEKIIYFGDTAHLPYGDKSADSIKYYCIRIAQFLLEKKCKAIVIACNTASSVAFETVKDFVGKRAEVYNVIDPVVKSVTTVAGVKKVGVIGTKGTIKSNAYPERIEAINSKIKVASVATPLLAPMIEEGFFNNKISRSIISSYLSKPKLKNIDALILACTHYPLIKKEIEECYSKDVFIVDSAQIVADHVREGLAKQKLLTSRKAPLHEFFVSDYTQSFEKSARCFFGEKLKLQEAGIWK